MHTMRLQLIVGSCARRLHFYGCPPSLTSTIWFLVSCFPVAVSQQLWRAAAAEGAAAAAASTRVCVCVSACVRASASLLVTSQCICREPAFAKLQKHNQMGDA